MKKLLTMVIAAICAANLTAQNPVLTFEQTEYDFGKINEADGRVTTTFEFKNDGMAPLVLNSVRASCGCTTPKWTKEPVEPGQSGTITVTYNPNGRPGRFQKTITVQSNASETTKKLYIKGEVIPKPAKPVNQYPVKMGVLSVKTNTADFGNINKGETNTIKIEYANKTNDTISVGLMIKNTDYFVDGQATLNTVKPNETGEFVLVMNTNATKLYGPVSSIAYVVVNNEPKYTEEYQIVLKGYIKEDFSNLTTEERQSAPIADIAAETDLGTVNQGQTLKRSITIANNGMNTMYVRRVYSKDENLKCSAPKPVIKSGKKADIKMEIQTTVNGKAKEPGTYQCQMVVMTNDPKAPEKTVSVKYTVK